MEFADLVHAPRAVSQDATPRVPSASRDSRQWALGVARAAIREPLVHFLAIGVILFGLSSILDRSSPFGRGHTRIHVSAAKLQQLKETWTARWGNPPDAGQMQTLVDDFVREDVMYREAIASGLDRDDTVIRRHLAQKVEFLAQGVTAADEPTDAELQPFFDQHRDRYAQPAKVAFSHVYVNVARRGATAAQTATSVLASLRAGRPAAGLGDAFMLQSEYPPQTHAEVRDLFGVEFATQLFQLAPGEWRGPVKSSYGLHVVRIDRAIASRVPVLEEVRSRVKQDFVEQRVRSAVDGYYETLRKRYTIDVDPLGPAAP